MSSDDRQLRDELEQVQGEVKRLRAALAHPEVLPPDLRSRVEQLRESRADLQQQLAEAREEVAGVRAKVKKQQADNALLQRELASVTRTEGALVDETVQKLDPGPRAKVGCLSALAALAVLATVGAWW